jgi:hypothetical protein
MEMMEGETTELRIKKGSGGEFGVKVSPVTEGSETALVSRTVEQHYRLILPSYTVPHCDGDNPPPPLPRDASQVRADATCGQLMQKVRGSLEECQGSSNMRVRLIFQGRLVDPPAASLASLKITHKSVIHCVMSPPLEEVRVLLSAKYFSTKLPHNGMEDHLGHLTPQQRWSNITNIISLTHHFNPSCESHSTFNSNHCPSLSVCPRKQRNTQHFLLLGAEHPQHNRSAGSAPHGNGHHGRLRPTHKLRHDP